MMTDEQVYKEDAAGISLPEEPSSPLHPHLIQLQCQVNNLTQAVAGLVAHLRASPAPAPTQPPAPIHPAIPSAVPHPSPHTVELECYGVILTGARDSCWHMNFTFLPGDDISPESLCRTVPEGTG